MPSIRVILPAPLCVLAGLPREVTVSAAVPVTPRTVLNALESTHPRLLGTLRETPTGNRRPLVRFFACEQDISHDSLDAPLPESIARGTEPFVIIGAIAGG